MPTFFLRTVLAPFLVLNLIAAAPAAAPVAPPAVSGPAVTLTAHVQDGHDAIVVDGTTPRGGVVTVTVSAKISRDLPDVTLRTVHLGSDGTFHATIGIGQTIPHETTIVVKAVATAAAPAIAVVKWGFPNPAVNSRMDGLPKQ